MPAPAAAAPEGYADMKPAPALHRLKRNSAQYGQVAEVADDVDNWRNQHMRKLSGRRADSLADARQIKRSKNPLVVNLNGSFHSENRLGTPEHLLKYNKKAKFLVVTMRYEDDFKNFDKAKHEKLGDFVILTDAKIPRSKR